MRAKIILCLLVVLSLLFYCQKEKSTEPAPDNGSHPQVDIPWPSLADSPWPMFHHDPQSTGRSQYSGPRKGKIKWTFEPGGGIYSSVVIGADSTIYFPVCPTHYGGPSGLFALHPNGTLKWKLSIALASEHQLLIAADGTIFMIGGPSLNTLYAINPDGTVKNAIDLEFKPWSSLNIGIDGTLYITSLSGPHVYAINQQGTILWKFTLPNGGWGAQNITISPDGETLYLFDYLRSDQITGLYAVGTDGQLRWHYPIENNQTTLYSSIVDSYGNIYFGTVGISANCGFHSISSSGKLDWKYSGLIAVESTLDIYGNLYFEIVSSECKITSTDYRGNFRWEKTLESQGNRAPYICDREGIVYICTYNAVSAYQNDGDLLWQTPIEGSSRISSAIGYDGTLYVGVFKEQAKLYAIE